MQKSTLFWSILFSILAQTVANAQQTLDFGIKGGFIYAPAYFRAKNVDFKSSRRDPGEGYSSMAQASIKIDKNLQFGIEAGISRFENYLVTDIVYKETSNNYTEKEVGHYEVNQYHIAGIAEYRFGYKKTFFVNVGGGYFKDQKSEFTDGIRFVFNGSDDQDLTGKSYKRASSTAVIIGGGVRPKIFKRLHALIEGRYTYLPPISRSEEATLLNFNVFNFNLGLAYSFPIGKHKK